jgi:outer membrane lipoprotein-sorting protein
MNILRRLPTPQLLGVLAGAVLIVGTVTAVAIAAIGGGPVPPPKPLDQAIHSALNAPAVQGVTARIKFTNSLIDTSSVDGTGGNPLLRGADGRLWASNDGRLRLELFSSRGDSQLSIDGPAHTFTFYDGSSNSVYQGQLPAHAATKTGADKGTTADQHTAPALKSIDDALAKLAQHAVVSPANPTDIAGQAAYSVRITPKASEGGMIGGLQLAWDAAHGIPLDVALYAKGSSSPVLELQATNISFGTVPASDFTIGIPPGAKVNNVDTMHSSSSSSGKTAEAHHGAFKAGAQGLAAVRAALPFALDAPPTLDNLAQSSVRQLTVNGQPAALLTYGQQLGTVVVLERAASATRQAPGAGSSDGGGRLSLPTTAINGAKASILPTAIGTLISFERNGISYTIAGSVPRGVAEAVARGL